MEFGCTREQRAVFDTTLAEVRTAFGATGTGPDGFYRREDWPRLGEFGPIGLYVSTRYGGGGRGVLATPSGCPPT